MSNKNWIVLKDLRKGGQGDSLHFVVPIYQRVFAWGSKEVERLLHDLYCHFVINARTEEDYHLGVITVVRDAKGQMILVDGQQRLTCLMLLGAVLGLELDVQKLDYESRPKDRKVTSLPLEMMKVEGVYLIESWSQVSRRSDQG